MDHDDFLRLAAIFVPHIIAKRAELRETNGRLVHYTSADNALKMISNREIWLRNSQAMNDSTEVLHGYRMMLNFFSEENGEQGGAALKASMEAVKPGVFAAAIKRFNESMPTIGARTFVTCLSEHRSSEDIMGRLSLWRGYGTAVAPVALVINTTAFHAVTNALGAFSNPVSYWNESDYFGAMRKIPALIDASAEFIRGVPDYQVEHLFFQMLLASAVSVKHPGFGEELEWRVLHVEKLHEIGKLQRATEVISRVPQIVYKLPLRNLPEEGISGLDPDELVNRVIIGPTRFPWAVAEAIVDALTSVGVNDAGSRVVVSDIPLRT